MCGVGALTDYSVLYIQADERGVPRWWREDFEDTVNAKFREQMPLEQVLDLPWVTPWMWPVLVAWTLEAFVRAEIEPPSEGWYELMHSDADAKDQLKRSLLALIPDDPREHQ